MKFTRKGDGTWRFTCAQIEWLLLREVLEMYPVTPSGHHVASRGSASSVPNSTRKLLDEVASAQQHHHRKLVRGWIDAAGKPDQGIAPGGRVHLRFMPADLEHLLRVLNDIRVGSWIALGCPDDQSEAPARLTAGTRRFRFAMEFSGLLQSHILTAMTDPA